MPTSVGPNTFGEENLVFGYDLGDTVNSYKGEPTVNIIVDPLYALGTKNAYYDTNNTGWGTVTRGRIEEVIGPFGKPVQAYSQELISYNSSNRNMEGQPQEVVNNANCLANLTSGVTYRISVWIKATYTGTSQNRLYLSGTAAVGDSDNRQVTTEWQRFSKTYTPSTSGAYYMRHYDYSGGKAVGAKIWYAHPQVEVNKGHDTQFTTGTRSATQGLIDLTGNSTIDLTNVSFDSNAQMTFDGTNDYVGVSPRRQYTIAEPWTTELVFKPTTTTTSWNGLFGGSLQNGGYWMFHSAGNLTYYEGYSGEVGTKITYRTWTFTNTFTQNEFHHLTIAYSPNTATNGTFTLYYNGGEKVDSFSFTFTWSHSLDMQFIGAGDGRFGTNDIHSFKQYNRALTATEIKANYNAIKGRFNI